MLQRALLIFLLFSVNIGELLVLKAKAFCNLDMRRLEGGQKVWVNISPTCCGKHKLLELRNHRLYHCLDKCYTIASCASLYFDKVSLQCLLFSIEEPNGLIGSQYMTEAIPNSSSFIVRLNREEFKEMVRCISDFLLYISN